VRHCGGARVRTRARRLTRACRATRLGRLALLGAALLVATTVTVPRDAPADADRFIPWTRADTPVLALRDLSGRTHTLADHRGTVLLINFWATWCEPCREEMPSMRTLRERLAGRFEILAINYGEAPSRVREFLERERLDFVALLDPNQDAARAWRVRVLPGSFLVDAEGRVRYSVIGEVDWTSEAAVRTVRSLLPTTTPGGTTPMPGGRGGR
jgi:cytochrome c biogenesis protein CcmG, thiol:disulfide interchange protein DsbE